MNRYHSVVIDFFGKDWFEENWKIFCEIRKKYPAGSFAKEILELELNLHPICREVFRYQESYDSQLDFSRIPEKGSADFILSHLGRDIELLQEEIRARGSSLRESLLDPARYEAYRFNMLVGAGYKLLGYKVEFVPEESDKKTPDLFVKKNNQEYYVECKQRNQDEADKESYLFFGELVERYVPLMRFKKIKDTLLDIQIFNNLKGNEKSIDGEINKQLWRNQKRTNFRNFKIGFYTTSSSPELMSLLRSGGHFQKYPVFTRTEDMFIASDPLTGNVVAMTKTAKEEKIPSNVYGEIHDANKHDKKGKKLLVYYDMGRGFTMWTDQLAKQTYEEYNDIQKKLPNIDGFIFCQTLLKYKGTVTEIRPFFNCIGSKEKLGGTPIELNLFGFQGHTGLNSYVIPEFVTDPKIFLQCPNRSDSGI